MKMKPIPEVNKIYHAYDDGKLRSSRQYEVKVTEVIPFNNADKEVIDSWELELDGYDYSLSKETDYFIKAVAIDEKMNPKGTQEIYVRSISSGWLSLGFMYCSELDVDGELTELLKKINKVNNEKLGYIKNKRRTV